MALYKCCYYYYYIIVMSCFTMFLSCLLCSRSLNIENEFMLSENLTDRKADKSSHDQSTWVTGALRASDLAGLRPCRPQTLPASDLAGLRPCGPQTLRTSDLAGLRPCRPQTLQASFWKASVAKAKKNLDRSL